METFFAEMIGALPIAVLNGFASNISGVQERARYDAALLLFAALHGFEVLVDTPSPPSKLAKRIGGGTGVPATSEHF
jgi:hypothetical protein